jgi:hypothetical protein
MDFLVLWKSVVSPNVLHINANRINMVGDRRGEKRFRRRYRGEPALMHIALMKDRKSVV